MISICCCTCVHVLAYFQDTFATMVLFFCFPQADETSVKCFIPLNPVRFSSAVLDAMDKAVPSHLPSPVCTAVPQGKLVICIQIVFVRPFYKCFVLTQNGTVILYEFTYAPNLYLYLKCFCLTLEAKCGPPAESCCLKKETWTAAGW